MRGLLRRLRSWRLKRMAYVPDTRDRQRIAETSKRRTTECAGKVRYP